MQRHYIAHQDMCSNLQGLEHTLDIAIAYKVLNMPLDVVRQQTNCMCLGFVMVHEYYSLESRVNPC